MQRFTVTDQHIALLKRAYVVWEGAYHGAPAINCKRPYGNYSVYGDIGEILGIAPEDKTGTWGEDDFTDEQLKTFDRLHRETETALQIFLRTGAMEPGDYEADDYMANWREAK